MLFSVITKEEIIYMKQTWSKKDPDNIKLKSDQVQYKIQIILYMEKTRLR